MLEQQQYPQVWMAETVPANDTLGHLSAFFSGLCFRLWWMLEWPTCEMWPLQIPKLKVWMTDSWLFRSAVFTSCAS